MGKAARQLLQEAVEASVEPWEAILGETFGSPFQQLLRDRVEAVVARFHDGDDSESLALAVVSVLFGKGDIPPEWWRTPLGLLVGPHLPDAGMTQAEAAAALGVKSGTVGTRVRRGNLAQFGPPAKGRLGRPSDVGKVSRRAVVAEVDARHRGTFGTVMTADKLEAARRAREAGESYRRIASMLGVGRTTVTRALTQGDNAARYESASGE